MLGNESIISHIHGNILFCEELIQTVYHPGPEAALFEVKKN